MSNTPKILIVDDVPRMCDSLKVLFSGIGYEVKTAKSGREVIGQLVENDFDLVLLDVVLPDMDGYQVMGDINHQSPSTPIIIFTGYASTESAIEALRRGAYDYIRKPFNPEELFATVEKALNQKELIDDSKRTVEVLRETNKFLRSVVDSFSGISIISTDLDQNILFWNRGAEEMFGFTAEAVVGHQKIGIVFPGEEERKHVNELTDILLKSEEDVSCVLTESTKNGRQIQVHLHLAPIVDEEGDIKGILHIAKDISGQKSSEEKLKKHCDHLKTLLEKRTAEILRANKKLEHEIYHRKQIEKALKKAHEVLKRTKNKFVQLETTCSKDEPVAVFASKTRQSLMVQKDKDRIAPSSISKDDSISVELAKRNIKPVLDSIHHLRAFVRQSQMVFSPFHVNKVLEASFQEIEEQFMLQGIEVKKHLDQDLPMVHGDDSLLKQVFLNLISNAMSAIEARGVIKKERGGGSDTYAKRIEVVTRINDGDKCTIEISIKDNGVAIPLEHMKRLFDPFFTTKEIEKRNESSFFVSYGTIKDDEAEIAIVETGPEGTCFRIRLHAD